MKLAWLVLIAAVGCASRVHADPLEDAKRIAKQASVQYQLGHFAEASDAYSKAFETAPAPGLLFNIGQCQMMLKHYERAIFLFEGYLQGKPDAPNVALVHDLIAEAKRELAAEVAKAQVEAEQRRAAAAPVLPPAPPPPAPAYRTDKKRIAAVALGATGVALVSAGLYLGLRAQLADDLGTLAGQSSTAATFDSLHRTYTIAAATVGGVGAAALIASGVLGYFGWRHGKSTTSVAAAPSSTGGTALVAGTF